MSRWYVSRKRPFVPPEVPKTPKSEATRARVLSVAADLFIDQGYEAVSLRDIADKAQLTHAAIYGHFRSKGQLLVEVIRWKLDERDRSPEFVAAVNDPQRSAGLLTDAGGRDVRLLQVDAAAAARHDADVAAGMLEVYAARHEAVRDSVSADVLDPDTAAFIISIVECGIGMKESLGVRLDDARLLPALRAMLASMAEGEATE